MLSVVVFFIFFGSSKTGWWQSKRGLSVRLKPKNTGEVISVYRSNCTANDGFPVGRAEIHGSESRERSYHDNSTNRARTATEVQTQASCDINPLQMHPGSTVNRLSQHPLVSCFDLWGFSHGVHVHWECTKRWHALSFLDFRDFIGNITNRFAEKWADAVVPWM